MLGQLAGLGTDQFLDWFELQSCKTEVLLVPKDTI